MIEERTMMRLVGKLWGFTLAGSFLLVVACGGQSEQAPQKPTTEAQQETGQDMPAQPIREGALPAGHPPIDQAAVATPPPPGSGTGATGLSWTADPSWIAEAPSTGMRKAQYRIPHQSGDGECVVFYFGPRQGGEAMMNAIRWSEQFAQPDGQSSREGLLTKEIEVNGISVLLAEISGTYTGGFMMGGSQQSFPGYLLLGAVAKGPDANWFFKFTGPEATVEANRAAFEKMILSMETGK